MVPVGESRLELLEATSENSTIAKFIASAAKGCITYAYAIPDLPAAVERLKKDGVRPGLRGDQNRCWRHKYVFVHPASSGGVLLELVQK